MHSKALVTWGHHVNIKTENILVSFLLFYWPPGLQSDVDLLKKLNLLSLPFPSFFDFFKEQVGPGALHVNPRFLVKCDIT